MSPSSHLSGTSTGVAYLALLFHFSSSFSTRFLSVCTLLVHTMLRGPMIGTVLLLVLAGAVQCSVKPVSEVKDHPISHEPSSSTSGDTPLQRPEATEQQQQNTLSHSFEQKQQDMRRASTLNELFHWAIGVPASSPAASYHHLFSLSFFLSLSLLLQQPHLQTSYHLSWLLLSMSNR